jgi:DNA repair exonuclease SbcCD ATPase subunit
MMRRILFAGILSVAIIGCNKPQNPGACQDAEEARLSDDLLQAQKKMTDALKQDGQKARRVIQIDQKMISLLSSSAQDESRCIKAFTSHNHPEEEGCLERMKKSAEALKALRPEVDERERLLGELR